MSRTYPMIRDRNVAACSKRNRVKTAVLASKYQPLAARGPEDRDIRLAIAGKVGRGDLVRAVAELQSGRLVVAAACVPPLAVRRTEDGDVGPAVTVVIALDRLIVSEPELCNRGTAV